MKKKGCWIFLSHSSKDIEKVRLIRNAFEEHGQNPLAFHLRCLNTDTEEGRIELDSLIKREIDAREWFVFCESEAASESYYVNIEKDYIKSTGKKMIWSIDMSLSEGEIVKEVGKICKDIKVYISYSRMQSDIAIRLFNALAEKDYDICITNLDGSFDSSSFDSIRQNLYEIVNSGFFIALLSDDYIKSEFCMSEFSEALRHKERLIVIEIDNNRVPDFFKDGQLYKMSSDPTEEEINIVVEYIGECLRKSLNN